MRQIMMDDRRLRRGYGGFHGFFLCWASNRHDANISLVAGAVAGCLMALVLLSAGMLVLIENGFVWKSIILLSVAVGGVLATYGTWRGNLLSTFLVGTVGVIIIGWLVRRGDIAAAAILVVPLVFGPITAGRGAYVLGQVRRGVRIE